MADTPESALTRDDVLRLERERSARARAETAEKVGQLLAEGRLEAGEAEIAGDVIARLAGDADTQVRAALARQIATYPLLPSGLADRLARDVESVSIHVLEHSPALSDDLLLQIIAEEREAKQIAIARRREVSETVSDALIETRNAAVVGTLLGNEGAAISEAALARALDDHADHPEIPVLVARRPGLSGETCLRCAALIVADQLEASVANEMRRYLIQQQNLPEEMAAEIVAQAREQAVADMAAAEPDAAKVAEFVSMLGDMGRLTPTMLLRALCSGDMRFVEMAFARLARRPLDQTAPAFAPNRGDLFRQLYDDAKLPRSLRPAFAAAVAAAAKERAEAGDGPMQPARYVPTVIAGIVGCYGTVAPAELEHVLAELSRTLKREAADGLDSRAKMRI